MSNEAKEHKRLSSAKLLDIVKKHENSSDVTFKSCKAEERVVKGEGYSGEMVEIHIEAVVDGERKGLFFVSR